MKLYNINNWTIGVMNLFDFLSGNIPDKMNDFIVEKILYFEK